MKSSTIRSLVIGTIAVAAGIGAARTGLAGSETGTLDVSATVGSSCVIGDASVSLAYDPVVTNASTPADGSDDFSVTCTQGLVGTITLNNGANVSGAQRRLKQSDGTTYLTYDLYSDDYSTQWSAVVTTGSGVSVNIPVKVRIPAGQTNALNGKAYTDSVTATISW